MNRDVCIVVLNYNNYKDTVECVKSIISQNYNSFKIIVVDNGSDNNSYEIIKESFSEYKCFHIIKNNINLGFAKGNNIGINYAKDILRCNNILVLNNDTIFTSNNILGQIMMEYPENVGLVSPLLHGTNGNMQLGHRWEKNKIKKKTVVTILFTMFDLLPSAFRNSIIRLKRIIIGERRIKENHYENYHNKYQVQGACFMLTPSFFEFYDCLFPNTFLYFEEVNLIWYLHKARLDTMAIITDKIIHKEAQTTSITVLSNNKTRKKAKYTMFSIINSLPMLFVDSKDIKKRYSQKIIREC